MECQFFQWLIAGAGPTTLQHALVGIGCLLAFDAVNHWRNARKVAVAASETQAESAAAGEYRRAA